MRQMNEMDIFFVPVNFSVAHADLFSRNFSHETFFYKNWQGILSNSTGGSFARRASRVRIFSSAVSACWIG